MTSSLRRGDRRLADGSSSWRPRGAVVVERHSAASSVPASPHPGEAPSPSDSIGLSRRPHAQRPSGRRAAGPGQDRRHRAKPPRGGRRPASRAKVVRHRSRLAAGHRTVTWGFGSADRTGPRPTDRAPGGGRSPAAAHRLGAQLEVDRPDVTVFRDQGRTGRDAPARPVATRVAHRGPDEVEGRAPSRCIVATRRGGISRRRRAPTRRTPRTLRDRSKRNARFPGGDTRAAGTARRAPWRARTPRTLRDRSKRNARFPGGDTRAAGTARRAPWRARTPRRITSMAPAHRPPGGDTRQAQRRSRSPRGRTRDPHGAAEDANPVPRAAAEGTHRARSAADGDIDRADGAPRDPLAGDSTAPLPRWRHPGGTAPELLE